MSTNEQAPMGGHRTDVSGNNYGQIVTGNNNTSTMTINAAAAGISENDRDEMRVLLDELRAKVREVVPEAQKEAVQKEVRELSKEVEADEPDASKIKQAIEWISNTVPEVIEWTTKAVTNPFVSKAMAAAGTAIARTIGL